MKALILAGGGGTRLWPLSKKNFPKQFLCFFDDLSLLQKTVQRLEKIDFINGIVIATTEIYFPFVKKQIKVLDCKKPISILQEPCARNTAPSIALSLKFLEETHQTSEDEPILVLPSDQWMQPEELFEQKLRALSTEKIASHLVTFGIQPTKPETGYGYIQADTPYQTNTFTVKRFEEKPNLNRAKQFFQDPSYYWNAGIFLFTIAQFWKEIQKYAPKLFELSTCNYAKALKLYPSMPNISIDYALMEHSKQILVCPLSISWSDMGSFDSLYDMLEKDEKLNVKMGNVVEVDTERSLIIGGKKLITTVGVKDLLIVETEDAIFIGKKGESQRIKYLVEHLLEPDKK